MSGQAGRYQRSFGGMVGSMIVLLVVIGAVLGVRALNSGDPPAPGQAIDYAQDVKYYKTEAKFDLVAPTSLPAGWKATSQRFVDTPPQSWHLGCLTDDGHYVGLEQARIKVETMVATYVDDKAIRGKDVTIDGTVWQTYTDSGGDHAFVRSTDGTVTLVVGSASLDDLETFVGLLA